MFALLLLCAVSGLKFVHGGPKSYTDLGITPPQFKSSELQDLAQRVVDDADYVRKQVLALANADDYEISRLNAILASYKSLVSEIQGSKSCSADDVSVTKATFQECMPTKDSIDAVIAKAKHAAQSAISQLQTVDGDLAGITDSAKRKLKIADANWLTTDDFYTFVSNANNEVLDERYNIQSCIDETSAQVRGQVQVNLNTLDDCMGFLVLI